MGTGNKQRKISEQSTNLGLHMERLYTPCAEKDSEPIPDSKHNLMKFMNIMSKEKNLKSFNFVF